VVARKEREQYLMREFTSKILSTPLGSTYLFSVGQAGFIIKNKKGQLLGIDLYLSDCVERIEGNRGFKRMLPKILEADELKLNGVIATHFHRDHYDIDSIPVLVANGAQLFAACDCKDDAKSQNLLKYNPIFVSPGDRCECGDFQLLFTECDHGSGAPFAVGVIIIVDGKKIYITGDTCLRLDRVDDLKQAGPFDAVIGPINGAFGNMNEKEFALFANELKCLAIPCHYGMFPSHGGNPGIFYDEMCSKYSSDRFCIMAQGEMMIL